MRATEIVLSFDEREIEAMQNALDCFSDESCTVEQKLREAFDSLYTEFVPPEMQSAIEMEILKENIARQEQIEADKRFGLFHIRENNEDRYYLNEFIQQPFASAYRYRLYSQNELSSEPKRFADALLGSVPITVIDYENLAERFEDEPKILSVMDFDLDDGTVSVTDADGSRAYSLQNVSAAAYLHLAAEHGNQYAAQLIHSIRVNGNWTAALASLRLLGHMARIIQNRLEDERRGRENSIDRKLLRKIEDKKQAQGLRQG